MNNNNVLTIEKLYQYFNVDQNSHGSAGSDKGQFMNNCPEACSKFDQMYSVSTNEEKKFLDLLKQDRDFFKKIYYLGNNNVNYFQPPKDNAFRRLLLFVAILNNVEKFVNFVKGFSNINLIPLEHGFNNNYFPNNNFNNNNNLNNNFNNNNLNNNNWNNNPNNNFNNNQNNNFNNNNFLNNNFNNNNQFHTNTPFNNFFHSSNNWNNNPNNNFNNNNFPNNNFNNNAVANQNGIGLFDAPAHQLDPQKVILSLNKSDKNSYKYVLSDLGAGNSGAGNSVWVDEVSGFCFVGKDETRPTGSNGGNPQLNSNNCYVVNYINGKTYKIKPGCSFSMYAFINNGVNVADMIEEVSDIEYNGDIKLEISKLLEARKKFILHGEDHIECYPDCIPKEIFKKFKTKNITQNNNVNNDFNNSNSLSNNNFNNNFNNNNFPNNNFNNINNLNNNFSNNNPNNNFNNNNNFISNNIVNQNIGFSEDQNLPSTYFSVSCLPVACDLSHVINISKQTGGNTTPVKQVMYNTATGFCFISNTNITSDFFNNQNCNCDIVDATTGQVFKLKENINSREFMKLKDKNEAMKYLELNKDKKYTGNIANEVAELQKRQQMANNSGMPGASAEVKSNDLFNHFVETPKIEDDLSKIKQECLDALDCEANNVFRLVRLNACKRSLEKKLDAFNNGDFNALNDIDNLSTADELDEECKQKIANNKQWGMKMFQLNKLSNNCLTYNNVIVDINKATTIDELNNIKQKHKQSSDERLKEIQLYIQQCNYLLSQLKNLKQKQEVANKKKEEEDKKKEDEEKAKKDDERQKKAEDREKKKEEFKKKLAAAKKKKQEEEAKKKQKEEEEKNKIYVLNNQKAYAYQFGIFKRSATNPNWLDNQGMAMWYNFQENVFVVGECKDDQMLANRCWVIDTETGKVFNLIKTCDFESVFKLYNIITDEFCKLNDKKEYKGDLQAVLNLIKTAPHDLTMAEAGIPQQVYNKIVDNLKKKEAEARAKAEEERKQKQEEAKKKKEEEERKKEEERQKKEAEERAKKKEEDKIKKKEEEEKKQKQEELKQKKEEEKKKEEETIQQIKQMTSFNDLSDATIAKLLQDDFDLNNQVEDVTAIVKDNAKSEEEKQQAIAKLKDDIKKKKQQLTEEQQKQQEEQRKKKQQQMLDQAQEHVLLNEFKTAEEEHDDATKEGKRPEVNILICVVTFICAIVPMIIYLRGVFNEQEQYDQQKQQLQRKLEEKKNAYQQKKQENMQKYGLPTPHSQKKVINKSDIALRSSRDVNSNRIGEM